MGSKLFHFPLLHVLTPRLHKSSTALRQWHRHLLSKPDRELGRHIVHPPLSHPSRKLRWPHLRAAPEPGERQSLLVHPWPWAPLGGALPQRAAAYCSHTPSYLHRHWPHHSAPFPTRTATPCPLRWIFHALSRAAIVQVLGEPGRVSGSAFPHCLENWKAAQAHGQIPGGHGCQGGPRRRQGMFRPGRRNH